MSSSPIQDGVALIVDPVARWFQPAFGLEPEAVGVLPGVQHERLKYFPPTNLRRVHDPTLMTSAWRRMVRWLNGPAQVWIDLAGIRHVNVLGSGVYSVAPDGTVWARLWEVSNRRRCELEVEPAQVSLSPLPYRRLWLANWARHLAVEAEILARRRNLDLQPSEARAWAEWAMTQLWAKARHICDVRAMRRRLAAALALDPLTLAIARRCSARAGRDAVTVDRYNQVACSMVEHRKLLREAPELSDLFELLKDLPDFPSKGEPLQRLRSYLIGRGLTPRGWRMVLRSRSGRLLPPPGAYRWRAGAAAIDHILLLDKIGWHAAPPRQFTRELLATRVPPRSATPGYARAFTESMPILRRIARWVEAGDSLQLAHTVLNLRLVMDMLEVDADARRRAIAGRPGWATLVSRAKGWSDDRASTSNLRGGWPQPACEVEVIGHRLAWIGSPVLLVREGRVMRHCVFDFAPQCESGDVAVASVFRLGDGRHVATLMTRWIGGVWQVAQLVGVANRSSGLTVVVRSQHALSAAAV